MNIREKIIERFKNTDSGFGNSTDRENIIIGIAEKLFNEYVSSKDTELEQAKKELEYCKQLGDGYFATEWKDECRKNFALQAELDKLKRENEVLKEKLSSNSPVKN